MNPELNTPLFALQLTTYLLPLRDPILVVVPWKVGYHPRYRPRWVTRLFTSDHGAVVDMDLQRDAWPLTRRVTMEVNTLILKITYERHRWLIPGRLTCRGFREIWMTEENIGILRNKDADRNLFPSLPGFAWHFDDPCFKIRGYIIMDL